MYDFGNLRGELADYFREKADYRNRMAGDHPCDVEKNGSYAASLELVANYVGTLPNDDSALTKLADCAPLFEWGFFQIPKRESELEADKYAIHCGPRGSVIKADKCGEWFACWADLAIADASRLPRQGTGG